MCRSSGRCCGAADLRCLRDPNSLAIVRKCKANCGPEHMRKPPSDLRAIFDHLSEELSRRSFASDADLQRFLDARMRSYNTRPQPELGGLSPMQMTELLEGDWHTIGALRVNDALSPDDAGDPEMLQNAVAFLTTLRDEGPAKATAGGNLSREFVGRMLPRLRFRPGYLEDVRRVNKVIDEADVWPLEILRHLLELARLVNRRKGFFHLSSTNRAYVQEERRGALLALLFRTFFQRMDLRFVEDSAGDEGLQRTIAFTFWKLRTEADTWALPAHLAEVAWLDSAKDPVTVSYTTEADFRASRFRRRVLDPLVSFGLLESRDLPAADRWEHPIEVRKTPLYDRLLQFTFDRG
jgi:hypothetical protein